MMYVRITLLGERSEPHMGDTSGIFHILLSYVRRGLCDPLFFFFGVRCVQYNVHAQCSFTALAPHMPCMLLVLRMLHVHTCTCQNDQPIYFPSLFPVFAYPMSLTQIIFLCKLGFFGGFFFLFLPFPPFFLT